MPEIGTKWHSGPWLQLNIRPPQKISFHVIGCILPQHWIRLHWKSFGDDLFVWVNRLTLMTCKTWDSKAIWREPRWLNLILCVSLLNEISCESWQICIDPKSYIAIWAESPALADPICQPQWGHFALYRHLRSPFLKFKSNPRVSLLGKGTLLLKQNRWL